MAGIKTLINLTGHALELTLVVRKGDLPQANAGTVDVKLAAGGEASRQVVHYGDATDIYLNGIETRLVRDGSVLAGSRLVLERGSPLDAEFNTHDTLEFLFDGQQVLSSAVNAKAALFSFPKQA